MSTTLYANTPNNFDGNCFAGLDTIVVKNIEFAEFHVSFTNPMIRKYELSTTRGDGLLYAYIFSTLICSRQL